MRIKQRQQKYRTRLKAIVALAVCFAPSEAAVSQSFALQTHQGAVQLAPSVPSNVSSGLASPNFQADFTPVIANGNRGVSWGKGHLVGFGLGEMKEPVTLYDKTGKWLFEDWLRFENAARTYVQDAVATPSGTAVVAVSVVNNDGAAADLIAEVGKDGIRRVVRTSPFYPLKICATDDGKVWAYGKELTEDRRAEPSVHYPMLREYSFDKGELRSALDRATVRPPKGVPVSGSREELQMKCNAGKVVLISGPTMELMEYDLSASRLTRWPMAPLPDGVDITRITGAALTDSGKIYVSTYDAPNLNALTRILQIEVNASGTADWDPVAAVRSDGRFFVLMGSDGEDLVHSRGRRAPTLFWSKTQKEVAK